MLVKKYEIKREDLKKVLEKILRGQGLDNWKSLAEVLTTLFNELPSDCEIYIQQEYYLYKLSIQFQARITSADWGRMIEINIPVTFESLILDKGDKVEIRIHDECSC